MAVADASCLLSPTGGLKRIRRYFVLRFVWILERRLTGGVLFSTVSLEKVQQRLNVALRLNTPEQNHDERLRRAANVTTWVLNGLITTEEIAVKVAAYEARACARICLNRSPLPPGAAGCSNGTLSC